MIPSPLESIPLFEVTLRDVTASPKTPKQWHDKPSSRATPPTPRYFKEHVKRRAARTGIELVSMDDRHVFSPEFHVLHLSCRSHRYGPAIADRLSGRRNRRHRRRSQSMGRAGSLGAHNHRSSRLCSSALARQARVSHPAGTADRRAPLHAARDRQTQRGDLRSKRRAGSGDPRTAKRPRMKHSAVNCGAPFIAVIEI